jgi:hypothetical protein
LYDSPTINALNSTSRLNTTSDLAVRHQIQLQLSHKRPSSFVPLPPLLSTTFFQDASIKSGEKCRSRPQAELKMQHTTSIEYYFAGRHCNGEERPRGNQNASNFCDRDRLSDSSTTYTVCLPHVTHEYILTSIETLENLQVQLLIVRLRDRIKQILYNMDDNNRRWTNRESPPPSSRD